MKKWRMIWGAVILAGMLGGCQAEELPEDPLDMVEKWFGKSESRVVHTFGLDEEEWTTKEGGQKQGFSDRIEEYSFRVYQRTAELEGGGTVEASIRFVEDRGMDLIIYDGRDIPTDRESFYTNVIAFYERCVELFGEPAISTEEKEESRQQYDSVFPYAITMVLPMQTEGLDWTDYGDIDSFYQITSSQYQKNDGQPAAYQLRSFWWDASDEMPFTEVGIRIDYHNPDSENMTFDYYFTCCSSIIYWDVYQDKMRIREEAGHETNAE